MRRILFALSSALVLTSCGPDGSGDSPSGAPTPTPSPSPTATPTPTPTPVASYSTFDGLAGDQTYPTGCVSAQRHQGVPKISPATDFGSGLQFTYAAGTQIHALSGDGVSASFGPADYSAINSGPNTDTWFKSGGTDSLTLKAPVWAEKRMVYSRVFYYDNITNSEGPFDYFCVTGVSTLAFDIPTSGTSDFPKAGTDATAFWDRAANITYLGLTRTIVSFQADFAAKKVSIALRLILTSGSYPQDPQAITDLGTVIGSGTIDGATGRFSGSWSSTDYPVVNGNFAGSFFGPQAQEFGLTYAFRESVPNMASFSSYGAITGSR